MAAKEDPLPSGTMELDASSSINEAQETHPVFEGDLISALPPELALAVFGTLAASDVFALCKAALVCRNWHSLSNDVQIWKMLYWRDFADLVRTYATAWPSWPGTLASAHSSVHFPAPNTALGHVNLELHLDPETNEITADERATLPIHPLTDLTKVPHAVLETVRHRDFLRLLAIRDRHFGLGMRRERVEAAKAAMAMIDLPQSSRADLIALSLAPLPPSLPPAPKFSTLPKLIYFTARKDSRRSVIATAQELARYEIVFRFKDPEEMVPMQPDPDRQIISRFNQEGVYESDWIVGEQLRMRWRFLNPGPAYDAFNYISSDDSSDDSFDDEEPEFYFRPTRTFGPSSYGSHLITPKRRRSKRALIRSRIPPDLPAINLPNLSTDKPWVGHSRIAVEDYPPLTVSRAVFQTPKNRIAEEKKALIPEGKFYGFRLENDWVIFEPTGRIHSDWL